MLTSIALRPRRSSLVTTRTSPCSKRSIRRRKPNRWAMAVLPEMVSETMRRDSTWKPRRLDFQDLVVKPSGRWRRGHRLCNLQSEIASDKETEFVGGRHSAATTPVVTLLRDAEIHSSGHDVCSRPLLITAECLQPGIELQRFRVGQRLLGLHRPAVDDFAHGELDDLTGLGARNVGDLDHFGRYMTR